MDIFFLVATLGVIVMTGAVLFVLWRVERILKHFEGIASQISAESVLIREDLAEFRASLKKGKGRAKSLFSFFRKVAKLPPKP